MNDTNISPSPVNRWERYSTSPGWVKNLFLDSEFYKGPRNTFEVSHCAVKEAFTHFGIGEHEYFMSILLKSGAKNPLEVDFGCGRFLRKNQPGDIVFGGYHVGNSLKGVGPFESIGLYFPTNVIRRQFLEITGNEMPDFSSLHSGVIRDQCLKVLMIQLLSECRRGDSPGYTMVTDGIFQGIIGRIATIGGLRQIHPDARDRLPPASINRAVDFMQAHLADSIGIDELAAAAGVQKGHFIRLFKQTIGETPMRYMSRIRIEKAADLLRTNGHLLSIGQIASICGFNDNSHFSNEFRRQTGVTPSKYRDQS